MSIPSTTSLPSTASSPSASWPDRAGVSAPVVSVRGEALLEVPPEIADVSLTVTVRDGRREAVLRRLQEGSAAVSNVLASLGDAIERTYTSGFTIYPHYVDNRRDKPRGFTGHLSTAATVGDFDVLSDLFVAVGSLPDTALDGPRWGLRRTSPVFRQARIAAIADAVQRARDYAAAFDAQLASLLEVSDEGMENAVPIMRSPRMMAAAAPPDMAELDFDLEPAAQTVHGSVQARFLLTGVTLPTGGAADSAG